MLIAVALVHSLALPPAAAADRPGVDWVGSMHEVMGLGDARGRMPLSLLAHAPHLYALGALAGLTGEIQIWDGAPLLSRVVDGAVAVDPSFGGEATLLVWTQVARWDEVTLHGPIRSLADLDAAVSRVARRAGLDLAQPLPFRVLADAESLDYHVVNLGSGEAPAAGHEAHEKIQVRFQLGRQPVELLGFYSTALQGVLTHHGSNAHLHVRTPDGRSAGHVDALSLRPGARLLLPR